MAHQFEENFRQNDEWVHCNSELSMSSINFLPQIASSPGGNLGSHDESHWALQDETWLRFVHHIDTRIYMYSSWRNHIWGFCEPCILYIYISIQYIWLMSFVEFSHRFEIWWCLPKDVGFTSQDLPVNVKRYGLGITSCDCREFLEHAAYGLPAIILFISVSHTLSAPYKL